MLFICGTMDVPLFFEELATMCPLSFVDGETVTLEQMLLARDKRVNRQQAYQARYSLPIISFTLVMPGEIKNSSAALFLFEEGMKAIQQTLDNEHCEIIDQLIVNEISGPEAIIVVNTDLTQLKCHCIEIEQNHFLGRLWDIDVPTTIYQGALSRQALGYPARRCLVCDKEAKACGRSRQHTVTELLETMKSMVDEYRNTHDSH